MNISSIAKKQVVACTGLLLSGFVVSHLVGNLLLMQGPDKFNAYAAMLTGMRPAFLLVEFGLLAIFMVHFGFAIMIIRENRQARTSRYAVKKFTGDAGFAVKMMAYTGFLILFFVGIHLLQFTFSDHTGIEAQIDGVAYGLYGLVYNEFHEWPNVLFYIFSMIMLGLHLNHAFQSAFKTLGFNHPRYTPKIELLGKLLAITVTLGFSYLPLYMMFVADPAGGTL